MTLEVTVERLARNRLVNGILLMGTTGTDALAPDSDYDILLVLDADPAPVRIVNTWVDGRLTEIYCTSSRAMQHIVSGGPTWPDSSEEAAVVRWLQAGRIVFDRAGTLVEARLRTQAATPHPALAAHELYGVWQKVGYNLAQIQRYQMSGDATTREAVDWRLLYSVDEVKQAYFLVRQLPWRGEKHAIRYLATHDADFLDTFRRCLAETDRDRKVALYETLARAALAPVGELWERGSTVAVPGPGFGPSSGESADGTVESALAAWRDLIGEPDS